MKLTTEEMQRILERWQVTMKDTDYWKQRLDSIRAFNESLRTNRGKFRLPGRRKK